MKREFWHLRNIRVTAGPVWEVAHFLALGVRTWPRKMLGSLSLPEVDGTPEWLQICGVAQEIAAIVKRYVRISSCSIHPVNANIGH